jgi:hypothetical protein
LNATGLTRRHLVHHLPHLGHVLRCCQLALETPTQKKRQGMGLPTSHGHPLFAAVRLG